MKKISKYGTQFLMSKSAYQAFYDSDYEGNKLSLHSTLEKPGTVRIDIKGALMKYKSFWEFFGSSAYESIKLEINKFINDTSIDNIILHIDSPGGLVNGCGELAEFIYQARSKKNIVSYISGQGCSAAYYLASATNKIYAQESATVGSIGCIASYLVDKDENTKQIDIVSSNSEDKLVDIETDAGIAKIQASIDKQAEIFRKNVARYRETLNLDAIKQTKGGTFIGEQALEMKLVDEISDLETILKEFEMSENQTTKVETVAKDTSSSNDAVMLERDRVSAIMKKGADLGYVDLANDLVAANINEESALKMLDSADLNAQSKYPKVKIAAQDKKESKDTGFVEAMNQEENPQVEAKNTNIVEDRSSRLAALANQM